MDNYAQDASAAPPQSNTQSGTEYLSFSGTGGEYFRIWIVNLLLTIVTLGIYSAWAKVRRLRYFYGSTQLAGSSFEYHGDPLKILKGRLIALALIVPYSLFAETKPVLAGIFFLAFVVALPFIVVKSRLFQLRMSSWRNIRFDFAGTYGRAAAIYIGLAILIPFTLGLILPYIMYARQRFLIGEARFGTTQVRFGATPGTYYITYLVALGIIVAGVIIAALIGWLLFGAGVGRAIGSDAEPSAASVFGGLLVVAIFLSSYFFAFAFVKAKITNAEYGDLDIGSHRIQSDLQTMPLAGIYFTNTLFIALTIGLYTPWARVRLARYQVESMRLLTQGSLDEFVAAESKAVEATGGEIGDLLDMDFGL